MALTRINSDQVTDGQIANSDLATMPTNTIKGNNTGGAASPTDLTAASVRTLLNVEDGADVTDATNVNAAGAVMESDVTAKGQILVATASGTLIALAVGTNDQVLTADSAEASGVKWATVSGTPIGATMDWAGREADLPSGWYVMAGQTMGDALSGATIASDSLEPAHDILKHFSPNAGTEVWGTDLVELPDTRGRTVIGTDNMGGSSANRITAAAADTIGGTGGSEDHTLSEAELPVVTPSGSTSTTGNHNHTPNGGLLFGVNTSSALGAAGSADWATYGRQSLTSTNGNHSHTLTMDSFGSGNAHANVQPYIAMPKAIYLGA